MLNAIVIAIIILVLLAVVAAVRVLARRLAHVEETMTAPQQRYCVHLSYTADAAPWAAHVFPEGVEPALTDALPSVLVSPPMPLDAAEHFVSVFHAHVVEGPDARDYVRGHA